MGRDKIRIRFRKDGALRLISHRDLMRCFERMLRRAAIPFHSTAGFNPKPRLVFALSLGLGIVGCAEVVEIELDETIEPERVRTLLEEMAPPGLHILAVRRIEPKIKARVCRATYRIRVAPERREQVRQRIPGLMGSPTCIVQRLKPRARRIDVRPFLNDLRVDDEYLVMDFVVTPDGTARPDEMLVKLGLDDILAGGEVLERTNVELEDEQWANDRCGSDARTNLLPVALPNGSDRKLAESLQGISTTKGDS